ncbi:MAG: AAA family ATPase [Desulfuromonadaceae bacterium]|nr:AAA family ATPase [Desulfuromonadaceae bacterium]
MSLPNPDLQLAEEFVQYTNCHLFLTGKAGTGKTTFLHRIKMQTQKRLVVTAPTGVAAIHAGGVTLHSFFQIPFGPFVPGNESYLRQHHLGREKKNIIASLDLLVIDEISMVRADLLDCVDSILRRYRRSQLPFGGVQLLMIGDLHQLPPVVKESDWQILQPYYESPYFFSSTALARTEVIPVELRHIYRQADQRFIELLNRVRDNDLDASTLQRLNGRYLPDFSPTEEEGYITLCTHNHGANALNASKLAILNTPVRRFDAEVTGDFPDTIYPTAATLELKVGAQVMFLRNDSTPEKRYFNGKIGAVTRIGGDTITVRCPGDAEAIEIGRSTWENIEYRVDPQTAQISEKIIGTFVQYPLRLAWAITIHKSQGLTFDKAIIDAQAAFAHGQVYVALSRCRTLEGMVLSSPLSEPAIQTDPLVQRFARRPQNRAPSPALLESAKIRYQQQLLLDCFDFGRLRALLGRLTLIVELNTGLLRIAGVDSEKMSKTAVEEICAVGDNFQRQLRGLFRETVAPTQDPAILERLAKAADYFKGKIEAILIDVLAGAEIDTDNKEIRKRCRDTLKHLSEEATVKRAAVQSCDGGFSPCRYLRAISAVAIENQKPPQKKSPVTYSETDVGHPQLFQSLKEWRKRKAAEDDVPAYQVLHQKTLVQIAVLLPDTLAELKKIKGIGSRLAERYGEELVTIVADYRATKGITEVIPPLGPGRTESSDATSRPAAKKQDTKRASLELLEQGLDIPEIARRRGLAVSTIETHLAFFVENGELKIEALVADEKRQKLAKAIHRAPRSSLKELKLALGDDCSYGEIRLVLAHLRGRE